VLEGLGIKPIFEVDTYQQAKLAKLVIEATLIDEFSVVIARHPCMLKFTRDQRKKPNYKQKHVAIDQETCERIHTCIDMFGCPTFTRSTDGVITINTDLCIGDGSCIQTCPTHAITPARGKAKRGAS
jgi:indolepyruvate ferredoxin oxidoreductase alpha subunit